MLFTIKFSPDLSSNPTAKASERVTWQLCARTSSTCYGVTGSQQSYEHEWNRTQRCTQSARRANYESCDQRRQNRQNLCVCKSLRTKLKHEGGIKRRSTALCFLPCVDRGCNWHMPPALPWKKQVPRTPVIHRFFNKVQ